MKEKLNIESWNRKDHFHFFRNFEEPYFGVTIQVDVTIAYQKAKDLGISFFLLYLHKSLLAVNLVENFRYRIENESDVFLYDEIHASATVSRQDETFGFSYMPYSADFQEFSKSTLAEIKRVQNSTGLEVNSNFPNVIHFSSLPWLDFSSISHARSFAYKDSTPKISFGKMTEKEGKKMMPVSIHVHHALVDGVHVGKFVDIFQQELNRR